MMIKGELLDCYCFELYYKLKREVVVFIGNGENIELEKGKKGIGF